MSCKFKFVNTEFLYMKPINANEYMWLQVFNHKRKNETRRVDTRWRCYASHVSIIIDKNRG